MGLILNIETSTDVCSVCLAKDGEVLYLRETENAYSHNEVIGGFIADILKKGNIKISTLDAVAISGGPGSYTALRIGASTAKGICFALDIPLIAIDSLKVIANQSKHICHEGGVIIPMIDARRKEVYQSIYDQSLNNIEQLSPLVLEPNSYDHLKKYDQVVFCGNGAEKARDILDCDKAIFVPIKTSSTAMVQLSELKFEKKIFEDLVHYEPNYFKSANINVQKKNILR